MASGPDPWLQDVVWAAVPAQRRAAVWATRRPALRMSKGGPVASSAPGSRIGGLPVGATAAAWPSAAASAPLDLLVQLDLAEIARLLPASPLPGHGVLSFFYDTETPAWAMDPPDPDRWRVTWEQDPAGPVPLPDDWEPFPSHAIGWEPIITLPRAIEDDAAFASFDLFAEFCAVDAAVGLAPAGHQLLGWPHLLQGSMTTICQKQCPDSWSEPIARSQRDWMADRGWDFLDTATLAADWRLLLQLGSEHDLDWCWGDAGGLYFWIRRADLAARRFDRVWTVMQC